MNKQLLLILLGLILIGALVPWGKINFKPKQDDCQEIIDSLENEVNEARMSYMRAGERISDLNDSLYRLELSIQRNHSNYQQLKRQNEKLQKERAALINSFTDEDIERYLSNRYGK